MAGFFAVKIRPNPLKKSRFFIIVGTKVAKKAVQRNLIKRRARGIISRNKGKLSRDRDFFIRFLPPAANLTKKELEQELLKSLYG